jgi:UDP-N-acetyl-D-glucosamine dehydrogenase
VTYKPDIDDVRESPALDIIRLLESRGALVSFHDPFVSSLQHEELETPFTPLTAETLAQADCVLIATNHSQYDWAWVQQHARLIVDTRYALGPTTAPRRGPTVGGIL